jgi:hypothetical protein
MLTFRANSATATPRRRPGCGLRDRVGILQITANISEITPSEPTARPQSSEDNFADLASFPDAARRTGYDAATDYWQAAVLSSKLDDRETGAP